MQQNQSADKLEIGLYIEIFDSDWRRAVIYGRNPGGNIGIASYFKEGKLVYFNFAWIGFNHDDKVRFCDENS